MISSQIFINQGNFKFRPLSADSLTSRWIHGVSIVDINNDGF